MAYNPVSFIYVYLCSFYKFFVCIFSFYKYPLHCKPQSPLIYLRQKAIEVVPRFDFLKEIAQNKDIHNVVVECKKNRNKMRVPTVMTTTQNDGSLILSTADDSIQRGIVDSSSRPTTKKSKKKQNQVARTMEASSSISDSVKDGVAAVRRRQGICLTVIPNARLLPGEDDDY
jgi:hypothetical protein